jgi:hypothetical protein
VEDLSVSGAGNVMTIADVMAPSELRTLRIVFVTPDEPSVMPAFFAKVVPAVKDDIAAIAVVSPIYRRPPGSARPSGSRTPSAGASSPWRPCTSAFTRGCRTKGLLSGGFKTIW